MTYKSSTLNSAVINGKVGDELSYNSTKAEYGVAIKERTKFGETNEYLYNVIISSWNSCTRSIIRFVSGVGGELRSLTIVYVPLFIFTNSTKSSRLRFGKTK